MQMLKFILIALASLIPTPPGYTQNILLEMSEIGRQDHSWYWMQLAIHF